MGKYMLNDGEIPDEVFDKAVDAYTSTLASDRKKYGMRIVIAKAIMAERWRIYNIIAAEREYGDCHPDDINARLISGERERMISGWNAKENADGVLEFED